VAWATNAITGSLQETVRKLIDQASGRSWKGDLHPPSGWFEWLDPDLPGVGRKKPAHAVGPLDQANSAGAPVIGHAKVLELLGRLQAKGVEVINRNPPFVLMDQDKSRTGDRARIDSQRLGYGPDEPGLAGAQGTGQADHATGFADIGQGPPQPLRLLLGVELDQEAGVGSSDVHEAIVPSIQGPPAAARFRK